MERKWEGAVSELMGECDGRKRSIIALVKGEVIAAIVEMKGVNGIGEG